MSTRPDRRTRKRLAMRQAVSDAATQLFLTRGFDNVTVDEIAEAADVGRMTVFNHFPRKELTASLPLATWTTAFVQAHHCYSRTESAAQAKAAFLSIVDQGSAGLNAALHGTPYV